MNQEHYRKLLVNAANDLTKTLGLIGERGTPAIPTDDIHVEIIKAKLKEASQLITPSDKLADETLKTLYQLGYIEKPEKEPPKLLKQYKGTSQKYIKILNGIDEDGSTMQDLVENTGLNKRQIYDALHHLKVKGYVETIRRGVHVRK